MANDPIDPNIPCNEPGRQARSWVECPPGTGKVARRVKPCTSNSDPVIVQGNKQTPTLVIIPYLTANTEIEITIPQATKDFKLKVEGNARFQYSYVSGDSGTNFWEVGQYGKKQESGLNLSQDLKLYVRADKGSRNFKLEYWT